MHFLTRIVFSITILLMDISLSYSNIAISPPEGWVNIIEPPLNVDIHPEATDVHYLLYDKQINATGEKKRYYRMTYRLLNESAIADNGQQYFDFSPDYNTLTFHSFQVIRDGEVINQLSKERIQVIQREQDADRLMLDGRLSAFIILNDIRKGDIIDYSYSVSGTNPALKDTFYSYAKLQWSTPIEKINYRLLWPRNEFIEYKSINTELAPEISIYPQFIEYKITDSQTQSVHIDSQTPYWFNPSGRITFTNQSSWGDVVDWALPLYGFTANQESNNIAEKIKQQTDVKSEQLSLALQFVQNEIRYLGIEIGQGSYVPTGVNITLEKRYADCKGKVLLLLNLMKYLEIEGYPALVNTETGKTFQDDGIHAAAFDHVIVKAILDEKTYWLDPTRTNQLTDIDLLFQPDFDYALVLKSGIDSLEPMVIKNNNKRTIHESIDISSINDKPATLDVNTQYYGWTAENLIKDLASSNLIKLQKNYLNFYNHYYPGIETRSELEVLNTQKPFTLKTIEKYNLKTTWKEKNNRHEIDFYANSLNDYLSYPKATLRSSPYGLYHPVDITHTIEVKLHESNWNFSDEEYIKQSDFFDFKRTILFDNTSNTLTQIYSYQSKVDHVPADRLEEYLRDIDEADRRSSYGIFSTFDSSQAQSFSLFDIAFFILLICCSIGIIYSIASLTREKEHINLDVKFYPVSLLKFSVLSFLTYGLYICYWFYKNWQYVARSESIKISPVFRGIFVLLWFYPLLKRLRNATSNTLVNHWFTATLITVVFIAGYLIANSSSMTTIAIGMILEVSAVLALVKTINDLNDNHQEAYEQNSKWRARHIITGAPIFLVTLFFIASETALIPPTYVISGDKLWDHDLKFLQRNNIVDFNEKIDQFYSSDLSSYEEDGNGLTDKGVFSYWKDSNDVIHSHYASYHEVERIDVDKGSLSSSTTVKVSLHNGSSFILYLSTEKNGDTKFIDLLRERSNLTSIASSN